MTVQAIARTVPVGELADHPLNDNEMSAAQLRRLQANIKANGGLYPRLIVRELGPESEYYSEDGPPYQILDGHQRKPSLVALGVEEIAVDIWEGIDDKAALRLLSTLNNLHGSPIPVKRANLIARFEAVHEEEDAEVYLEESPEELAALRSILTASEREIPESIRNAADEAEAIDEEEPETLIFSGVYPSQREVIDNALEKIQDGLKGKNKRSRALEYLAANFLAGDQSPPASDYGA